MSRLPHMPEEVAEKFEAAVAKVRPVIAVVATQLHGISDSLTEVEVEFGLSLKAEAGILLSASAEGNFRVKLKFKREK